jgi:outer membrane protein assembly factor BamB
MRVSLWPILVPPAAVVAGAVTVAVWLGRTAGTETPLRLPAPEAVSTAAAAAPGNPGARAAGPGHPSTYDGSWPQFLNSDRGNVARQTRLASWDFAPPRTLWELPVGEGHAGPAVHRGRVYLVDYDPKRQEDAIRCLSLDDGREIWRYAYSVRIKRNHGISRTVPAVTDRFLVAIGPMGHVHCLNADTGDPVWKKDLVRDFGTVVPAWYAGQCPLIDGDRVILAPGGDPLMMAVDLATGEVLWRTPNPGGWGMTHSSISPVFEGTRRQYVYCATQGVAGVAAADGRLLWTKPDWKIALANVPTPLPLGGGRVLLSGGYNSGCAMVRLSPEAGPPEELFRLKASVFGADQATPVYYDGHIYGIIPGGELACMTAEGRRLWTSGAARFGLGPLILTDGHILALNDQTGVLVMAEAKPGAYVECGRMKVLQGHDAWGPMALAGRRLLLRDLTTLKCLELP